MKIPGIARLAAPLVAAGLATSPALAQQVAQAVPAPAATQPQAAAGTVPEATKAAAAAPAQQVAFDNGDMARFLAGLPPADASPLAALTKDPAWVEHARFLNTEWSALDKKQISKVRAFSATHLKAPSKTLFYTFSGPDMLYAEAFFPKATTYVLAGLEPIGPLPDLNRVKKAQLAQTLGHLKTSMRHIIGFSYFITLDMGRHLAQGQLPGVLPVLYVFLARAEKTVKEVTYYTLTSSGKLEPFAEVSKQWKDRPRAVKITFTGKDGAEQKLYYFNTDLSNKGVADSGFLQFCESLGQGDVFVKSASYLLHTGGFSTVREFLLKSAKTVLQDDTGIPLSYFKPEEWQLLPHGRYTGPIAIFRGHNQPKMKELFDTGNPPAFDFSLGYRWRPGQSSLLQAVKK